MKIKKFFRKNSSKSYSAMLILPVVLLFMNLMSEFCPAVTTRIFRANSFTQLSRGKAKDVVISSKGTIELGLASEIVAEKFEPDVPQLQPWSINCIAVNGSSIYLGTSPNGGIYKYVSGGKVSRIYPPPEKTSEAEEASNEPNLGDPNKPAGSRLSGLDEYLKNEHIYAIDFDISGNLLAAVSGKECKFIRLRRDKWETVFEPNDAKYIFAITIDRKGNIYLGTGPQGKIYRLDSFARNPQVFYTARDKNILSLAIGEDDFIYAGSDERGIVYKINLRSGAAAVLYDSDQPEITALLAVKDGVMYSAATSAQAAGRGGRATTMPSPMGGRPEPQGGRGAEAGFSELARKLQIANTRGDTDSRGAQQPPPPARGTRPAGTSAVYKITSGGFVTEVFSEPAVLFSILLDGRKLLVGTGNEAQLYSVDIDSEQKSVCFEDKNSSQITAVAAADNVIYVGTANPAKLIRVSKLFAKQGSYTSDLIDAGQPAKWGKLQIEANIPTGCNIKVSARSGNVKDVNDPAISPWSEPVEITEPLQLNVPVGRFCQYQLTISCDDGTESPVIREIAVAATVPNLAPKVESITTTRLAAPNKEGFFKIDYKATDENNDKLVYKIDLRRVGTEKWIELKDQLETPSFEWDSRTVEDGRYEIRITASDEKANTSSTKLAGSRISDAIIVDNTPPVIVKSNIKIDKKEVTLTLTASDSLSAVGSVSYTINSSADWLGTLPDDQVFDTTTEDFTVLIKDLKGGQNVVAVKISDDVGNTMYKSFDIKIPEN